MVDITVYDLVGEKIITLLNKQMDQGEYEVNFDASNIPSGVYIYRLEINKKVYTKKMILMK